MICLLACGRNINNKEAVRQVVIDHLSTRENLDLNLSAMEIDVSSLTLRGNEADATVSFRSKGSGTSLMQMKYTLERSGNHWRVKAKSQSGATPHGTPVSPDLPAGHPPVGAEGK